MVLRSGGSPMFDSLDSIPDQTNDSLPPSPVLSPNPLKKPKCPQSYLTVNGPASPTEKISNAGTKDTATPDYSAQQRAARFAQLRDALFYSNESAGFVLSADEKLVYPNVRIGQPPQEPVQVEDIEHYLLSGWECWDAKFARKLDISEYPVIRLSRERLNYHGYKFGIRHPDGKRTLFTSRGQCIHDPHTKEFMGGVTWLDEMGEFAEVERREQEEALRSFETICDSLPHMVWTAKADGSIDYVSKSWEAYTGMTLEQARNRGWMSILHPDDVEEAQKYDKAELSHGHDQELHLRYRRYDGSFRWTSCKARALKDENGKVLKWYGSITDVHDMFIVRQEAEKLQAENARLLSQETAANESSRLKGQFLAHMSHELRTPIAGIIGMVSLLRDTRMTPEQQDYADCITTSANNLLTIVNDILDYSKIESGRLQIEEIPFTLSHVIDNIGRVWKHIALQKSLNFEMMSNVPTDLKLLGDPTRIGQILSNLCSNALKFTSNGSITFVSHIQYESDHVALQMKVEDTGTGIEEHVLAALFTPFQQGDSSTARKHGGTGLGLTISRNLAQLMRGHLVLESERGKGTKASLTMKLKRAADNTISSPELSAFALSPTIKPAALSGIRPGTSRIQKSQHSKGRSKLGVTNLVGEALLNGANLDEQEKAGDSRHRFTVLIAEDNIINQRIAVKTVQKLGYKTFAAVNGQEALDYIANPALEIDCILMDVQMPLMDGYEATRRLRTEEPFVSLTMTRRMDEQSQLVLRGEGDSSMVDAYRTTRKLKDIPVIALTASAIPGDREKCFEAGMDDYMTKPLDPITLQQKLSKWAAVGRGPEHGTNIDDAG